ncbi:MAG TPA: carboxymuconolactone decarboxylase family protein [Candidatus Sulfotelmatobacter sp.]|nr:carboxymuconolactone decarboxylase family protein [Candidatus Sulfotelmatobacter sp.]
MQEKQRFKAVDLATAQGEAKDLLNAVQAKYGAVPNSFKVFANAPKTLAGFRGLSDTLGDGLLPFETRYQIAIAVSELNQCPYCLSAFTALGKAGGISDKAAEACRLAGSDDPKIDAALKFAKVIVKNRGSVSEDDFRKVKAAGYSDGEILEIVANVALYIFANYMNLVSKTEVDFPLVTPYEQVEQLA